ncbi:MAG: hypothetical protein K5770_14305 [Lachnospiraceae bacterium]|nr:hypothetical protein [Lachnospiraceae bacterium]
MEFIYTDDLVRYMEKKRRLNISVEVAQSNNSDFDVTEIYIRLVTDKFASYLCEKKNYRVKKTPVGLVLLPPYRLEYDETITFFLKKYWIFSFPAQKGITL